MFYDRYCELCKQRGITPTRAALEIGLSKSTPTAWKKKGVTPQASQLQKIADFFNVSTDYLLGNEQKEKPAEKAIVYDDALKFALFGTTEVDDATWDDVRAYAKFKQEQKNRR